MVCGGGGVGEWERLVVGVIVSVCSVCVSDA